MYNFNHYVTYFLYKSLTGADPRFSVVGGGGGWVGGYILFCKIFPQYRGMKSRTFWSGMVGLRISPKTVNDFFQLLCVFLFIVGPEDATAARVGGEPHAGEPGDGGAVRAAQPHQRFLHRVHGRAPTLLHGASVRGTAAPSATRP